MTTLYRLFNSELRLLYVGIAGNPGRRFEQHATDKPWWSEVAEVRTRHYDTRLEALAAERQAIHEENPRYNLTHHNGRHPKPSLVKPTPTSASARKYPDRMIGPRAFDHSTHVTLPEYHTARLALSELLNAGSFNVEDIVDMIITSYAGDFCNCCRERWLAAGADSDWYPTCWPYAGEVKDGWMVGKYRCPRTGREWTCGYTAVPETITSLP